MTRLRVVCIAAVMLSQSTTVILAQETPAEVAFQSAIRKSVERVPDILVGSMTVITANNTGTGAPCEGAQSDEEVYCAKITWKKYPLEFYREVRPIETRSAFIPPGLKGAPSFTAAQAAIPTIQQAHLTERKYIQDAFTEPVIQAWKNNRSAIAAVQERVNSIEADLPANINRYCTPKLMEHIHRLEARIKELESARVQ